MYTIYFYNLFSYYLYSIDTYKKDMNYLNTLFKKIKNYRKNNNVQFTKIYYAYDSNVDSHYSKKTMNSNLLMMHYIY